MKLGAHLSIAGGLHEALVRASRYGFDTVALFVRNQLQWRSPPLGEQAVRAFRRTRRRLGIGPVVAHGSYLLNLAGSHEVRRRSVAALGDDLDRCGRLGIEYLVFHPGSHGDPALGIALIAEALNETMARCRRRRPKILLETTAGAGNTIGRSFEQLAAVLGRLERPRRFGVCLDTCHVFAAGYDVRSRRAYRRTMARFDRIIGLDRLMAIHLNDSRGKLASRLDRHAHIGHGQIGLRGFANFVVDRRLAAVPMLLETPKQRDEKTGRDWDEINAEALRRLAAQVAPQTSPPGRSAAAPPEHPRGPLN
jgi:deoxyribonuclease-4